MSMQHFLLQPFQSQWHGEALHIQVMVTEKSDFILELHYTLTDSNQAILLPEIQSSRAAEQLWQESCFEAFIGIPEQSAYLEFNFSPSTLWAVYAFSDYRKRSANTLDIVPAISINNQREQFSLLVQIPKKKIQAFFNNKADSFRLGLSSVMQHKNGELSYWALKHPARQADFHHADSFIATLPAQ